MNRVLVCGGRDFTDSLVLNKVLGEFYLDHGISVIIHGAAKGADSLAGEWVRNYTDHVKEWKFPAKWKDTSVEGAVIRTNRYGDYNVLAGHQRNQRMLDEGKPDLVIAFPGGGGTKNMIQLAIEAGVPVDVVTHTKGDSK